MRGLPVIFLVLLCAASSSGAEILLADLMVASGSSYLEDLVRDASDGSLDDTTLLGAALVVCHGNNGASVTRLVAKRAAQVDAWAAEIRATHPVGSATTVELAQAIQDYLHAQVFTGAYELEATDVELVFSQGRYNCVSACILYLSLCERLGIDAAAVEFPGHVACRVSMERESLHVEPTCAEWSFSAALSQRLAETARGPRTDVSVAEVRSVVDLADPSLRILSTAELIAIVFYNCGAHRLAEGGYSAAIEANASALAIDPDNASARRNLLAAINNWALALSDRKDFDQALALLDQGQSMAPEFQVFATNRRVIKRRAVAFSRHAAASNPPYAGDPDGGAVRPASAPQPGR